MQGIANVQFRLGDMYKNGWGVIKDNSMAVFWYREAAEQGHAYAIINYKTEISVEKAENLATIVLILLGLYCVATGYLLQTCFLTFQICYSIFCNLGKMLIITLVCFRNNWQFVACFCAKLVKNHEDWFKIKEECENMVCQIDWFKIKEECENVVCEIHELEYEVWTEGRIFLCRHDMILCCE